MKAKDYALEFHKEMLTTKNTKSGVILNKCKTIMGEFLLLVEIRKAVSAKAIYSCWKEIVQKKDTFIRLVNGPNFGENEIAKELWGKQGENLIKALKQWGNSTSQQSINNLSDPLWELMGKTPPKQRERKSYTGRS